MIGQERLVKNTARLVKAGKFPRFCIFCGPEGSGKKEICRFIKDQFDDNVCSTYGKTVNDIRQLIEDCNKLSGVCHICIIPDADDMSMQAKNALLKLTEEPPDNAYLIMTLIDTANTLDTIRSRATIFLMQPYLPSELEEYAKRKGYKNDVIRVIDACETPGEIDLLYKYDIKEFFDFVNKSVDNIATVNGANVFKLADRLKLKDNSDGYDLKLFFKLFAKICYDRYLDTKDDKYTAGMLITSTYLKDLRIKGISKPGVVDLWILDIRKEWM